MSPFPKSAAWWVIPIIAISAKFSKKAPAFRPVAIAGNFGDKDEDV
jgi:hypothetical protein